MTRYGYPTPRKEDTIVWDKDMTAWRRDGGQWTQITGRPFPAKATWEELFTTRGPLETDQMEAAQDRFQVGETYRVRYAAIGDTPPENIPDAIANGKIGVYEAVYTLETPTLFILTPPEDATIDAPTIRIGDLMQNSVFILETERLIAVPALLFRTLVAGTPGAVSEAAAWYRKMYGKYTSE